MEYSTKYKLANRNISATANPILASVASGVCVTVLTLWCCLLFWFYAQVNDFSIYWHFDEPSKAAQFLSGQWNFNHPQLLLTATRVALTATSSPTNHDVVVMGRTCSAFFAAGSVFLFAAVAWRTYGRVAAIIAALFVGTGSLLFGLAHYMKEDTALLFGLGAFLLALCLVESNRFPSSRGLILGVGAGLASSGKYIGILAVPIAVIGLARVAANRRDLIVQQAGLVAGAVGMFVALNVPMLCDFQSFLQGILWEFHHVTSHHFSMVSPIWDSIFVKDLAIFVAPPGLLVFGWLVCQAVRRGRSLLYLHWLVIFSLAYLGIIQLSAVKFDRYILPTVVVMQVAASCGLAQLLLSHSRALKITGTLAVAVCISWNVWQLREANIALTNSSRLSLAQWIRTNVSANAQIAEEAIVGLSQNDPSAPKLSQRVITKDNAAEFVSIEALTDNDISYVAISDHYYKLFFNPIYRSANHATAAQLIAVRRRFYSDLFARGELVFEAPALGPPGTEFSPKIELYRISSKNRE